MTVKDEKLAIVERGEDGRYDVYLMSCPMTSCDLVTILPAWTSELQYSVSRNVLAPRVAAGVRVARVASAESLMARFNGQRRTLQSSLQCAGNLRPDVGKVPSCSFRMANTASRAMS